MTRTHLEPLRFHLLPLASLLLCTTWLLYVLSVPTKIFLTHGSSSTSNTKTLLCCRGSWLSASLGRLSHLARDCAPDLAEHAGVLIFALLGHFKLPAALAGRVVV